MVYEEATNDRYFSSSRFPPKGTHSARNIQKRTPILVNTFRDLMTTLCLWRIIVENIAIIPHIRVAHWARVRPERTFRQTRLIELKCYLSSCVAAAILIPIETEFTFQHGPLNTIVKSYPIPRPHQSLTAPRSAFFTTGFHKKRSL